VKKTNKTLNDILTLAIGIIPGFLWLVIFYYIFRKRSSVRMRALFSVFFWGAIITVPALILEVGAEALFGIEPNRYLLLVLSATLIIAPIEELLKYFVLKRGAFGTDIFTRPHDGIILGMTVGLGFATVENVLLIFQESDTSVIIARALTATLLHAVTELDQDVGHVNEAGERGVHAGA